ncbi:family 78 glycoside hydrolase catalytic domain [Actinoplanes sp. NPDC049265]|uniref:family 78 glycoside hydrolase catalytic domain n=1 Tax=Actinoplanes sp. NPDC049265 TaxID=3363902 RepID=UPI0037207D86
MPHRLRFEHQTDALGIGTPAPRLSWWNDEPQTAYELEITRNDEPARTFRVASDEQVLVPWPAAPLRSRDRVRVRVRINDNPGWSEYAEAEAGLLDPGDWTARFIQDVRNAEAPILSATVDLPAGATKARLYATAHGLYIPHLNGRRVGDHQLAPGWTAYQHRLRYQTYDVTGLIRAGTNRLDIQLGNGWYRGRLGFRDQRAVYGDRIALLAQLEVTTGDGQVHVLATDGSWTARASTVTANDLYDGQTTDLRRIAGDTNPVEVVDADLGLLVAPDGPPVRVTEVIPAQRIFASRSGRTLVDFGQNVVGRVRLRVRNGQSGQEIVLRHAEVLEDGELGVRPLRTAKCTDTWILAGPDEVTLEPELTFHGFRYAEITGAEPATDDIQAVVIHSDLERTGWFESSHELLNRFHGNVVRGMRGNFLDVPTDCPQRDERLGWTGDIQVFSPTATFLYDSAGFLTNWLADLAAEQHKDGSVPYVIPDVIRDAGPAATAWGDAATVVPWVVYRAHGDAGLLARQLPSMRAWVDRMAELAGPDLLWQGGFQFGDWLDPTAPPDDPFRAKADPDVIATAHLAYSAQLTADAAGVAGDTVARDRYADLAARARAAYAREYTTAGGRVLSDSATNYALALRWGLLPDEEQRERAGRRLADLVRAAGFRISTGFVGTPLMTDVLTDAGEPGLAYRLLLQTGCPSWLYAVTMGATTVWERWDSMLPDGSVNPGQMTSFNHYALGAVADWMHRRVAGLAPGSAGYRTLSVRPLPAHTLTSASARHLTPYGEAAVAWERSGGRLTLRVTVPVGSTATVEVPGGDIVDVAHGVHEWTVDDPYAEEPGLPTGATIRQLMDHRPSWDRVVAAAAEAGVAADEAALAGRLARYLDAPSTDLADVATGRGYIPGAQAFRTALETLLERSI